MSRTISKLARECLAEALDRATALFETAVADTTAQMHGWGDLSVERDLSEVSRVQASVLRIHDIARLKVVLAKVIRTMPSSLPPDKLRYDWMLPTALVEVGDAETFDGLQDAVSKLTSYLEGSTWDINAQPSQTYEANRAERDQEPGSGFNADFGDVGSVLEELEEHDEDAARQ